MPKLLKKNLVILQYASNTCYTNVTDKVPEQIEVDISAGTWTYKEKTLNDPEGYKGVDGFRIGDQSRHCDSGSRGGVIGIYDRTNVRHLDSMVHAAKEATAERRSAFDD